MKTCPNCNQTKKDADFPRWPVAQQKRISSEICTACYKSATERICKSCDELKPIENFRKNGHGRNWICIACEDTRRRYTSNTPALKVRPGEDGRVVTWQHTTPRRLPPIVLSGRVVGRVNDRLAAMCAGSIFVVEEPT